MLNQNLQSYGGTSVEDLYKKYNINKKLEANGALAVSQYGKTKSQNLLLNSQNPSQMTYLKLAKDYSVVPIEKGNGSRREREKDKIMKESEKVFEDLEMYGLVLTNDLLSVSLGQEKIAKSDFSREFNDFSKRLARNIKQTSEQMTEVVEKMGTKFLNQMVAIKEGVQAKLRRAINSTKEAEDNFNEVKKKINNGIIITEDMINKNNQKIEDIIFYLNPPDVETDPQKLESKCVDWKKRVETRRKIKAQKRLILKLSSEIIQLMEEKENRVSQIDEVLRLQKERYFKLVHDNQKRKLFLEMVKKEDEKALEKKEKRAEARKKFEEEKRKWEEERRRLEDEDRRRDIDRLTMFQIVNNAMMSNPNYALYLKSVQSRDSMRTTPNQTIMNGGLDYPPQGFPVTFSNENVPLNPVENKKDINSKDDTNAHPKPIPIRLPTIKEDEIKRPRSKASSNDREFEKVSVQQDTLSDTGKNNGTKDANKAKNHPSKKVKKQSTKKTSKSLSKSKGKAKSLNKESSKTLSKKSKTSKNKDNKSKNSEVSKSKKSEHKEEEKKSEPKEEEKKSEHKEEEKKSEPKEEEKKSEPKKDDDSSSSSF